MKKFDYTRVGNRYIPNEGANQETITYCENRNKESEERFAKLKKQHDIRVSMGLAKKGNGLPETIDPSLILDDDEDEELIAEDDDED